MKHFSLFFLTLALLVCCPSLYSQDFDTIIKDAGSMYREAKYRESAEAYEKAFKIKDPDSSHLYNAACSWALSGERDAALKNLKKAIEKGWLDLDWMKADGDLRSLHNDERWSEVLSLLQKKLKEIQEEINAESDDQRASCGRRRRRNSRRR